MKLISIELGRSTQVVVPDEIKPLRGEYFPETVRLVSERYGFGTRPTLTDISKGAKFTVGQLIAGNKKVNIVDLTVFSNAIQTTVSNTSDADFVLDDIVAWGIATLGYRQPETKLPRIYESHVVVEFERPVEKLSEPFAKLKSDFQTAMVSTYGLKGTPSISSFGIGIDPLKLTAQLPPPFPGAIRPELSIAPRLNHPYSSNRFFSTAPLRTEVHLTLLEDFESAIP